MQPHSPQPEAGSASTHVRWLQLALCLATAAMTPLSVSGAAAPSTQAASQDIVLLGRNQRIAFATGTSRVVLKSLSDTRDTHWAGPAGEKASLWHVAMRGPNAAAVDVSSSDLSISAAQHDAQQARFTWKPPVGNSIAEISLTIDVSQPDGLSIWHLTANVPDGWTVVRADWPILPGIHGTPDLKMAAPFGWGLEYDVKPGMSYEGTYPSLVTSMPFVAFYGAGNGLYVGIHDKHAHHKHLAVKSRDDGTTLTWTHWPSDSDTVQGRYDPPFDAAVGTFVGDYWNAAQFYARFVRETPWGRPNRTVPDWLKSIDLWLMPGAEPLKNVEACRKAGAFFGVPIALHWYNWHEIPFDTLYPEYFPAKPNFREGVKALQDAGFRIMPYINGRLCDSNSATWRQGGEAASARNDQNKPYTEVYGSKVPLNVMCPATKLWQDKIGGIVDRLVNECGVDGVYIDQINAAHAVRCFSTAHGHAPGGGGFWAEGYRKMLDQIRAKLPADRVLTTEENAECWNDQFDALLMVNTPASGDRRIIPLMPAVYGGRVITFGFQYIAGNDDIERSLPFRAKMARAFLYGAQLGWVSVDVIMAEKAAREAEFLRNLAKARQGAHEFLLNGLFLGEVEVTGDNPRLNIEGTGHGGKYNTELPAVMATAWMSKERTVGLAVVNMSNEPRSVVILPPWHRALRFSAADIAGRKADELTSTQRILSVTVPARDAQVYRAGPAVTPIPQR